MWNKLIHSLVMSVLDCFGCFCVIWDVGLGWVFLVLVDHSSMKCKGHFVRDQVLTFLFVDFSSHLHLGCSEGGHLAWHHFIQKHTTDHKCKASNLPRWRWMCSSWLLENATSHMKQFHGFPNMFAFGCFWVFLGGFTLRKLYDIN